ncbi:hypothetical protein C8R45DRAFT_1124542 [Mycena sanguinolenta]|nr:hypothetical protein C8R45DRAFT_1124542 [Mycena sanguinolenta]
MTAAMAAGSDERWIWETLPAQGRTSLGTAAKQLARRVQGRSGLAEVTGSLRAFDKFEAVSVSLARTSGLGTLLWTTRRVHQHHRIDGLLSDFHPPFLSLYGSANDDGWRDNNDAALNLPGAAFLRCLSIPPHIRVAISLSAPADAIPPRGRDELRAPRAPQSAERDAPAGCCATESVRQAGALEDIPGLHLPPTRHLHSATTTTWRIDGSLLHSPNFFHHRMPSRKEDEEAADLDGLAHAHLAPRPMSGSPSQSRSSGRSSNSGSGMGSARRASPYSTIGPLFFILSPVLPSSFCFLPPLSRFFPSSLLLPPSAAFRLLHLPSASLFPWPPPSFPSPSSRFTPC